MFIVLKNYLKKKGNYFILTFMMVLIPSSVHAEINGIKSLNIFDVRDFGAAGDGVTLDTKSIQAAINESAENGGGRVILPAGKYLSGTLFMKSNVTLEISEGAVLLGSTNIEDYPDTIPSFQSFNDAFLTQSLIYGDNLQNIAVVGRGTIDGQGSNFVVTTREKPERYKKRPYVIRFIECENILIENLTMKNSAMWMQQYLACEFLTIRGINVFNHANQNNDMMDIDGCRNVIISDCFGDTDDDGITFKSTSGRISENIAVTNCVISSHVNAIKFGTESIGGFKNVSISNITIRPSAKETTIYGVSKGVGGLILELVDGGIMDGITISNIRIDGVQTPIFLRLGNRGRTIREGMPKTPAGSMKNISISDVIATGASDIGSSIHGIPGHMIENVSLNNINISYSGGGTLEDADRNMPEKEEDYPESYMFGKLPAYGFYIRHVKGISLNNIRLHYEGTEKRPAFILHNIENAELNGITAKIDREASSFIKMESVKNSYVHGSKPIGNTKTFLHVIGSGSKNINLSNNFYSDAVEILKLSNDVDVENVKVFGEPK
jgi:polygalacturonase